MKKIFALMLALMLLLTFASAEEKYNVGVCQLVQHVALDDATRGFADALSELLGERVEIEIENASGDLAACNSIVNNFIAEEVDLIMANATPALQAAQAATGDIPILGASVTDYGTALGISPWTGVTGQNVSGTSDLSVLYGQAQLIREMFPDAKKVGLLYCTAEANSVYQVEVIEAHLAELGYDSERFGFTDSNDVASIAQNACLSCDVIYVPTDNTVASCAQAIRNVVEIEKKPIVGGDEGICAGCGVVAICINYYDLGYETGKMAYEILENGADVSQMPIRYSANPYRVYNAELCQYLGIPVPHGARLAETGN